MIPWTLRWHWTIQIYTAERDTLVLIQDTCWGIPDRMILEYLKWRLSQTGFRLIAFVSRCIQSWLVVSTRRLAQSDIDWISINWDCLRPCHGQTHGEIFIKQYISSRALGHDRRWSCNGDNVGNYRHLFAIGVWVVLWYLGESGGNIIW